MQQQEGPNPSLYWTDHLLRQLQVAVNDKRSSDGDAKGRTILTVLYLCVLGLCFLTPIIYYCRLHYEERHGRRLRSVETARILQALRDSAANDTNRQESRAAKRKYIEERRARIIQLFAPVRMVLEAKHFPEVKEETLSKLEEGEQPECSQADENASALQDIEDEDAIVIEIPKPGLHLNLASGDAKETRIVPGMCSICLSPYEIGSDIVWSSNVLCEHVFHEECIEHWLMKKREGPLCPCCRRDFIVDPYDFEEEIEVGANNDTNEEGGHDPHIHIQLVWNQTVDQQDV